ncbi:AAA family ATPase [Terrabacter sp. NPDC080008]|uniref:AAA family ATPase n=1 Tax=Terrabacter sp. NPDC080008 TaxID=3155176 RepID=UPI00344C1E5D
MNEDQQQPKLMSHAEVLSRGAGSAPFLVPGLVSADLTGVIGEPYAGKSSLVVNLVNGALTTGDFLGRRFTRRPERAVLVCTDAGLADEYARRLEELAGPGSDFGSVIYAERAPRSPDGWEGFAQKARIGSGTLVVVDNLSGVVDTNNAQEVRPFLAAVVDVCVTARRAPVVVVAHSSAKPGFNGRKAKGPMGLTSISGAFRLELRVAAGSGGALTVETKGNQIREPERLCLTRGSAGAGDLHVTSSEPLSESAARRQTKTLDQRADMARFVVEQCQGLSKADAAAALARTFGGSSGTHAKRLQPSQPLGQQLVHQDGSWALASV